MTPTAPAFINANLIIFHNAYGSPHVATRLNGIGLIPPKPIIIIDPVSYNFGQVIVGESSDTKIFTISNTGNATLIVSAIDLNESADFYIKTPELPLNILAGESNTFSVNLIPASPGAKSATVSISHNASDDPDTISLSGIGLAPPFFTISPTSHSFSEVIIGETSLPQTFTITNSGGSPLIIYSININGIYSHYFHFIKDDLPWNIPAEAHRAFTVSFTPIDAGEREVVMDIFHNAESNHGQVELSGIGIAILNPPHSLELIEAIGYIKLSWHPPDSGSTGILTGYRIYRSLSENGEWVSISGTTPISDTTYEDKYVDYGVIYWYKIVAIYTDTSGISIPSNIVFGTPLPLSEYDDVLDVKTALLGNFPNPFNPETTIKFNLATPGHVRLEVFNIRGQLVRILICDFINRGIHSVVWDGTDEYRRRVGSGIYFYRMATNEYSSMRRMILLK
jgi:hypothetical protein